MQERRTKGMDKDIYAIYYKANIEDVLYIKSKNKAIAFCRGLDILTNRFGLTPNDYEIISVYHRPDYTGWYWEEE
jgi:hypothetical protein